MSLVVVVKHQPRVLCAHKVDGVVACAYQLAQQGSSVPVCTVLLARGVPAPCYRVAKGEYAQWDVAVRATLFVRGMGDEEGHWGWVSAE